MKFKHLFLFITIITLTASCASGYKAINPETTSYVSSDTKDGVTLQYEYGLLHKKYRKKALKNDIRLAAVTIKNESGKDLVFGKDLILTNSNGNLVYLMTTENLYQTLKQKPASYLWYLLLSPLQLYTNDSNNGSESESSFPIGLIIGPGLAGGNMIAASSANKNFKQNLQTYNLNGITIANGQTVHGIIGIQSKSFDALKVNVK
ncbi:hypothetical protein ACG2LH_08285 [Zhouia sp. PK063]|uniref:hypothetical protein n=1 Tax=Zhouia sp. PK063 TaxID=3373602 RepID=UPI0037BADAF9